jgi:prepilin-type N-terminal cleavage/methylation domain-containing protein
MKKNGFTLLELLIVMAMIMIMTVVSLVFLGNNKKNKELEAAARAVSVAIREAQNNALAGKQITADRYPCVFRFKKESDPTTFSIKYTDHDLSSSCTGATENTHVTYALKNNVRIENSPDYFYFSVPFGEVCTENPPNNCSNPLVAGNYITIQLCKIGGGANDSNCYTVCVTPTGNIYERPNKISCT